MIDEQTILAAERLRDDLTDLRSRLRKQHKETAQQVRSDAFRKDAATLAEKWLVEIAPNREVVAAIGTILADMNVQFQRLLTFSEHATTFGMKPPFAASWTITPEKLSCLSNGREAKPLPRRRPLGELKFNQRLLECRLRLRTLSSTTLLSAFWKH